MKQNVDLEKFCKGEKILFRPGKIELPFNIPWRKDKIASGSLNVEKCVWYDHGTGDSGNLIHFIERAYKLSTREAKTFLLKRYSKSKIRRIGIC